MTLNAMPWWIIGVFAAYQALRVVQAWRQERRKTTELKQRMEAEQHGD